MVEASLGNGNVHIPSDFLNPPFPDGYTLYSVSQERFLDELEDEAKAARARAVARASSGP